MKTKPETKCYIDVTEKPVRITHRVEFKNAKEAKRAMMDAIGFWNDSGKTAVKVDGENKIVIVSTDCVSSVILTVDGKSFSAPLRDEVKTESKAEIIIKPVTQKEIKNALRRKTKSV